MSINKQTMSQMIYEKLKEDIISRHYQPGEQLKEVWIAKELDVSSTPVREAFKQLQAEGFLESLSYKGVYVKQYDKNDLKMAYMVRARMESLALRLIMEDINEDETKVLNEIMDETLVNETEHPIKQFFPFHDWIIRNTRTDIIIKTLMSINGIINIDVLMRDMKIFNEKFFVENHKKLFELIKVNDMDGAEKQLEYMILRQMEDLVQSMS